MTHEKTINMIFENLRTLDYAKNASNFMLYAHTLDIIEDLVKERLTTVEKECEL